ncbi:hypothetical protein K2Q16_00980 [Patescibacteria group bacterium]|nr:hypothetical protein [Patescibacteria group bacterium]
MKTLNFHYFNKLVFGFVFVLFAFTTVYIPQDHTPRAEAQNVDPAAVVQRERGWFQSLLDSVSLTGTFKSGLASLGINTAQWSVTSILNGLAWAAAKNILSMIQRDIVRWINSGFQGSPAFIQDLGGFITNIADETAGQLIQEIGGPLSFVCSPFQLDVRIAVASAYNRTRDKNARRCTLTGALQNIQNFIGGDMNQGGWDSWIRIVHQPQSYTPLGSALDASAELGIRIRTAQGREVNLLNWGGGFMSSKVCETVPGPSGDEEKCRVSTPGNVIANQLNRSLGLGDESLIAADQINEIIGALMQQMVKQVLTGAGGLLGAGGGQGSNSKYTDPNFNVDLFTAKTEIQANSNEGRKLMIEAFAAESEFLDLAQSFIVRYQNEYSADGAVQARAAAAYNEAREVLPKIQDNLTKLQAILANFDSAPNSQVQQQVLQDFTAQFASFSNQIQVDAARERWISAFIGMGPRPTPVADSVLDSAGEALSIEELYLDLVNSAIDQYETLTNPSPAEKVAYNEAFAILPDIQRNVIDLRDIIDALKAGDNDAEADFTAIKPDLHTEVEVTKARVDWEAALGTLP